MEQQRDNRYEDKVITQRREPVEPKVLHMGLLRMRNAARGNGVDPDTISMHGFEGYTVEYDAQSLFVIQPTVAQKSLPGKEKGEVCASHADMHGKIREATEKTLINKDIIAFATSALERRKDKGFMVNGFGLKFDRLARTLLYYNACTNCTAGYTNCMTCQGAGQINCPKCRGLRKIRCPGCHGTKFIRNSKGVSDACRQCGAHGEIPCHFCKTTGRMKCKPCNGTGQNKCPKCAATGIISEMSYVSFEGKTNFTFDRDHLPEKMVPLLEQIGPQLVLRDYADVLILQERQQTAAQKHHDTEEKPKLKDELVVPFNVRLPWGTIQYSVEGKILDGKVFGKHPRLLGIAPFIERAIAPGVERLEQAAGNLGNVRGNIDEAVRFRIIADAMVAASAMARKKAVLHMRKRWSVGVSGKTTDNITLMAATAYTNISKMPRLAGLGLGLSVGALIDAAYLLGPLRSLLLTKGMPSPAMIALDLSIVAATGFIAESASRQMSRRALRHLFKKLLPPEQANKIRPQAGTVGLYAYIGAALLFVLIILGAAFTGHTIPDWAFFLLKKTGLI